MKVLLVCLLAAGCGGSGTGGNPSDANATSDALGLDDAPSALTGLLVSWTANPALPGVLATDLTVTSATFHLARLQVIGDNGQPMIQTPFDLTWAPSEGGGNPPTIGFASAPSGLYSQVTLDIDAPLVDTCYEIFGTTKISGVTEMFHIHDRNALNVDIKNYTLTLAPGGTVTAAIRLDLRAAIGSIDFSVLGVDNGYRDMDTFDPQMDDFREKIQSSFKKGP
jgi:hypothetical protein